MNPIHIFAQSVQKYKDEKFRPEFRLDLARATSVAVAYLLLVRYLAICYNRQSKQTAHRDNKECLYRNYRLLFRRSQTRNAIMQSKISEILNTDRIGYITYVTYVTIDDDFQKNNQQ